MIYAGTSKRQPHLRAGRLAFVESLVALQKLLVLLSVCHFSCYLVALLGSLLLGQLF